MKRKWIFFVAPPAVALLIAVCGEVVMHLWNALVPELFGLRAITFWQGVGLLVLCRILFGGLGCHGSDRDSGRRRAERENMTPEEREKFRQGLRSRCGGLETPAGGSGEPA